MLSRFTGGNPFETKPRAVPALGDCTFYHSTNLPDHDAISGPWDLRGREREYLGYVDFKGRSVIEYGPASGHLTFWMERQGAEVTVFETSEQAGVDLLPKAGVNLDVHLQGARNLIRKIGNSWWRSHHYLGSKARRVVGNIYDQPEHLGTFDVATIGMLLLHCRSPFDVVRSACLRAKEAVIITDFLMPDLLSPTDPLCRFNASESFSHVAWWQFSPGWASNILRSHGFANIVTVLHKQRGADFGSTDYKEFSIFTVVGRR